MYNPSVKEFLEKNKALTIIGLFWAGYWRLWLAIVAAYLTLCLVGFFIGFIIGVASSFN